MKRSIFSLLSYVMLGVLLASCSKSSDPAPVNGNSNNTNSSATTSTITYTNNSSTLISITVNGQTQSINAGASVVFTGSLNTAATGTATTSGKTTSGTVVGNVLNWTISNTFPSAGNLNIPLNVGSNFFFLKITNSSAQTITQVYVNYQLTAQTLDNVNVPNNGLTYNIGYYYAYTNSNVHAQSSTSYWNWPSLGLPFTQNQTTTISAY